MRRRPRESPGSPVNARPGLPTRLHRQWCRSGSARRSQWRDRAGSAPALATSCPTGLSVLPAVSADWPAGGWAHACSPDSLKPRCGLGLGLLATASSRRLTHRLGASTARAPRMVTQSIRCRHPRRRESGNRLRGGAASGAIATARPIPARWAPRP
ncbi:hypothetical protein BJY14_000755 [Actinomadura luteofluorescens]|uniref:Uncharacterized protein n=1 Tax=Actinomadura luteofluorescens TaxID=46163 RepID=A0A7Y9EBU0_9ACTN|nr:hypothetical protein [Actinomadura luteofluorescens]